LGKLKEGFKGNLGSLWEKVGPKLLSTFLGKLKEGFKGNLGSLWEKVGPKLLVKAVDKNRNDKYSIYSICYIYVNV